MTATQQAASVVKYRVSDGQLQIHEKSVTSNGQASSTSFNGTLAADSQIIRRREMNYAPSHDDKLLTLHVAST